MTLDELINKLTEIRKTRCGVTEVCVLCNSTEKYPDWLDITKVVIDNGNEEEMVSDSIILLGE